MFILTDPTLISINYIQQAHKKADNGFNDAIAELYEQELKTQEKAKEEHIKQAKKKAVEDERFELEKAERARQAELERVAEENRKNNELEAERLQQEEARNNLQGEQTSIQTTEPTQQTDSSVIGNDWSSVSPEQASAYMSARTGVSASTWQQIIYKESTNNPTVTNSIGCYGYLQLHPVHGSVSTMSPQQYLDTAVAVYNSQGLSAWEVVTNGSVQ